MLKIKSKFPVIAVALLLGHTSFVAQAYTNPDSTNLPNGAELLVIIDSPLQNGEFKVPAASGVVGTIDVDVAGLASVGEGDPNTHITFVADVSGSTTGTCGGGTGLDILGCEKEAILNVLNDDNIASVLDFGLGVFATDGAVANVNDPGNLTSSIPNMQTVTNSMFSQIADDGGVIQFTTHNVGFRTDFSEGLLAANTTVAASSAGTKLVYFFSDGVPNEDNEGFETQLGFLAASGATAYTFAIGAGADCDSGGSFGTLMQIANATGGTCTPVPDPSELPDILADQLFTQLDSVQVAVEGDDVSTITAIGLPADGPVSTTYGATPNLGVGDYNVTAAADGHDNAGEGQVIADVDIHLLQLTASPATEDNELNTDISHTVTAAILGGTGPARNIDFLVGGENVASASPGNGAILATPGGASVNFIYTVPQACASLGTDTITVTTTIAGMADSIVLEKNWIDTVPPNVSCDPTVNPHGNNKPAAPGNGGQGQNQDGFYQVEFEDPTLDCPVTLVVMDGDGYVYAGPFNSGDNIKYTQDDDIPQSQKKIGSTQGNAGAVTWHLIGHGDLTITATDTSGNFASASCLVPPKPQ